MLVRYEFSIINDTSEGGGLTLDTESIVSRKATLFPVKNKELFPKVNQ